MQAFHNDIAIKDKYLERVRFHQAHDNLVRGIGWQEGKGCAVGCTLENYNHARYEVELGMPEWLARVEDTLFEGMRLEKSKTWPEEFLSAISPGVDLEIIKVPFIVIVLKTALESLYSLSIDNDKFPDIDNDKFPDVVSSIEMSKNSIKQMIDAQLSGDREKINAAWSAATSAARSAESAAESADSAARSARSAAWAAESAARSAESAAESADSAARSARSAAWAAESADSAARSARSAWAARYDYFADELLKLLKSAK